VCEGLIMHDPTAAHKLPSTFPNPLPHLWFHWYWLLTPPFTKKGSE
jgi:hypothetical protein